MKLLVEINRLNFEHYQIIFWTERNLVKGGANPGDRTRTPETSDHGRDRNRVQNGPEWNVPIATGRDWVASHTTLVQPDWRALCQSTLPAGGQYCRWFFLQVGQALSPLDRHEHAGR